ncbi:YlxM family DNA-binding protein [Fusibacter tunisiensis]|uniref:UPF0122 protein JOC49_000070 n=1 Tax=Fusibacter tunisiensis TaxID=1008308 RepID=A0ABS2MMD6_9FIRM|nr:YlxM family DNA-binding protein [Fusibacter tunisiensis]MBM7560561.1 putative DNA-binding protein YlxM (UPF0122 family) [Fusibacter tunisiensis]
MFEKKLRLDALYDFYGKMLTEKQNEIMQYYCIMDYSLGEISELLGISRQAVHDTIKRTEKILENYEEHLSLYRRFSEKQERFEQLNALVEAYEKDFDKKIFESIKTLIKLEID